MDPLRIKLRGHLTKIQLKHAFGEIETELKKSKVPQGLVVDCSSMTGYDMGARSIFVKWNKKWHKKVLRVAIVTDNILWHMVINMMALASSQQMKPFNNLNEAIKWSQD